MESARLITAIVAGVVCSFGVVEAQVAGSQKIQARHGDLILVQDTDQIRIVRRRNANVRAIFDPAQRWLVLLVDYAATAGVEPDGRVDTTYTFQSVEGEWPLGQRWEGPAAIDDYAIAGDYSPKGIGFSTSAGLVQLLPVSDRRTFADQGAVTTLTFRGSGRGGRPGAFDDVEPSAVAQASARGATPAVIGVPPPPPYPQQPIRVGGNIRTPMKIRDVRPVYPPTAQAAGITGMVILEAIIGADGAVSDVKVVKSIPELDAAAMDAVRQWRFEPTLLNGAPVPVIMTVTVSFSLQ